MRKTKICCGLDVHKETIFAAINKRGRHQEVKEFGAFTSDIEALSDWLEENRVSHVAMESTGVYWIPVWNVLERRGFKLTLVNPYLIKQMPGRKSDVKDSQWIAQLLFKDMLRGSLIPDTHIRELRTYSREYVYKHRQVIRTEVAMERILEQANIRITSVASKVGGASVLKIIRQIISGQTHAEELFKSVHGIIVKRKGKEKILSSLQGCIREEHRYVLKQKMEEYDLLIKQMTELENKMFSFCNERYKKEMELLQTIPGIKEQSAMQIIAETGGDMSKFENSGKLTGWAGLRPRNDESAGKIKSKATTKGNKYLRRIIVQTAWAASRTRGSYFNNQFQKLVIRKGSKKALIAIARKQLTVVWNILAHKEIYNAELQPVYSANQIDKQMKYYQGRIQELSKRKAGL